MCHETSTLGHNNGDNYLYSFVHESMEGNRYFCLTDKSFNK